MKIKNQKEESEWRDMSRKGRSLRFRVSMKGLDEWVGVRLNRKGGNS